MGKLCFFGLCPSEETGAMCGVWSSCESECSIEPKEEALEGTAPLMSFK